MILPSKSANKPQEVSGLENFYIHCREKITVVFVFIFVISSVTVEVRHEVAYISVATE